MVASAPRQRAACRLERPAGVGHDTENEPVKRPGLGVRREDRAIGVQEDHVAVDQRTCRDEPSIHGQRNSKKHRLLLVEALLMIVHRARGVIDDAGRCGDDACTSFSGSPKQS